MQNTITKNSLEAANSRTQKAEEQTWVFRGRERGGSEMDGHFGGWVLRGKEKLWRGRERCFRKREKHIQG